MKAILGLGNPGLRFRFSRHNLGFAVVEKLAKRQKIKINQKGFGCFFGQGRIGGEKLLLFKPLTFMNLSGQAALKTVKQNKLKLADLLVVVDDINLPLAKIRIKSRGSDGGHKGLRSIIEVLKSQNFARLRIGVGEPESKGAAEEVTRHVLGKFNKEEVQAINKAIEKAALASEAWAKSGIQAAMNKFN